MKDWYSVKELAEELSLSEETIRTYVRQGKLVAHKFGNKLRFHKDDIEKFLREHRTRRDEEIH